MAPWTHLALGGQRFLGYAEVPVIFPSTSGFAISAGFRSSRGGFTLIELLVTIAIIGVLASLVFSGIMPVRAMAHRATCASNMRQIAMGLESYVSDNEFFPMPQKWASATLTDQALPNTLFATVKRCPAKTGRRDQFGSVAGQPARYFGMNAKLAPDQGDQKNNAALNKNPSAIEFPSHAAVIMETMQSEQWGGSSLVGFGWWLTRAGDLSRHSGGSNVLFADWHVEYRKKSEIPNTRVGDDAWKFWTGIAAP